MEKRSPLQLSVKYVAPLARNPAQVTTSWTRLMTVITILFSCGKSVPDGVSRHRYVPLPSVQPLSSVGALAVVSDWLPGRVTRSSPLLSVLSPKVLFLAEPLLTVTELTDISPPRQLVVMAVMCPAARFPIRMASHSCKLHKYIITIPCSAFESNFISILTDPFSDFLYIRYHVILRSRWKRSLVTCICSKIIIEVCHSQVHDS